MGMGDYMQPFEGLNEDRSNKQQPSLTEVETEIRSALLAAREMTRAEVEGLVLHLMDQLPLAAAPNKNERDYLGFFMSTFFMSFWLIFLPWCAFYLFRMNDSTTAHWAIVLTSAWIASILAAIATLLRKTFR